MSVCQSNRVWALEVLPVGMFANLSFPHLFSSVLSQSAYCFIIGQKVIRTNYFLSISIASFGAFNRLALSLHLMNTSVQYPAE